ncbi:MbtH family protein [Nisaea sp.]|uniref:MbtH family protein n=1 Tax=Nisaea sp. TaxID=2024842 RepID=UPI003B51D219
MTDNAPAPTESTQATHQVLLNEEEQYCLWPATKTVPAGWRTVFTGSHKDCVAHVEENWTDMRPKSVRD